MPLRDGLLAEYDHELATTRRLLERIPGDRLAWKPHPQSMTLGELATHLSNVPEWGGTILNDLSFDLAAGPPPVVARESLSEILQYLDDAQAKTRSAMDKTDAEYLVMWSVRREGRELFCLPRIAAFRSFLLNHLIHHRGQLSVYLRLNDVPVPPIYGPSADEG